MHSLAAVIGQLNASGHGMKYAPLYYKHLEIIKNRALKAGKGNYDGKVVLDEQAIHDLNWWITNVGKLPQSLDHHYHSNTKLDNASMNSDTAPTCTR